jgi:hypothetical protein
MEKGQSTVEKPSPQEDLSKVLKITNTDLNKLKVEQETNETKKKTDQLEHEIDKNKYENFPLKTYNEVVK